MRAYRRRLSGETLMLNELYIAVLYRPVSGAATGLLARAIARAQREAWRAELADALDACEKIAQTLLGLLDRYEPELLDLLPQRRLKFVVVIEYFALLIN